MQCVTDSIQLVQRISYQGTLVGFGYSKIRGETIRNVKYTEDLLLLAKKETVLWGVTDRLTEIRR